MKTPLILFILLFCISGAAIAGPDTEPATETPPEIVPFMFQGHELYSITSISEVSAAQRSDTLRARLKRLAKSPLFSTEKMRVRHDNTLGVSLVFSGSDYVCDTWDSDAEILDQPREQLAEERMQQIRVAIDAYRKDYTKQSLIQGCVFTAIATVLLLSLLKLLTLLKRKEEETIRRVLTDKKLFKLIDGKDLISINNLVTRGVRVILIFWMFAVYLNFVLSFFPWTFNLSATLFTLIRTPLVAFFKQLIAELPSFFALLIIFIITRYILKAVRRVFEQISSGSIKIQGFYADWGEPTQKLARLLVILFALVAAFPYIPGSNSPAFRGLSIFVGVLFSLGSTSVMGNIFAGLVITYMRPFVPGDFVEINQIKGFLLDRRTFSTRIQTNKNEVVTIPNASVTSHHITNYSRRIKREGVLLYTTVTLGYNTPWRTIYRLLLAAASETEDVLQEPEPFVLQSALEDFYVRYELNVATRNPENWPHILTELHQRIQDHFIAAGIEIMSPHYRHERTGNETTIPALEPAEQPEKTGGKLEPLLEKLPAENPKGNKR